MKRKQVLDYINSKCFLKQMKQNINDLEVAVIDIASTPATDMQAIRAIMRRKMFSSEALRKELNKAHDDALADYRLYLEKLSVTDGAKNKE